MMEFGKTLRLAREAKGYTAAQVAELTKMAPATVAELEEENFSHIAAPIYGRGFVKLYCEAVGLDPKPLVDEFMAMFKGDRDTGIRERKARETAPVEPPDQPQPPPAPAAATTPPPEPVQKPMADSLFDEEPPLPISNAPEPPPADPFAFQNSPESPERPAQRTLSRYAAPVRTMHVPSVPPIVWRLGILGSLALLILWGLAVGVRALYRATTSDSTPNAEELAEQAPAKPEAAPPPAKAEPAKAKKPAAPAKQAAPSKPAAPAKQAAPAKPAATKAASQKAGKPSSRRTPQKIPSLYVD